MSDEIGLQHAGVQGHVVTITLAMPDYAHRLFALICFPFSVPVAPTYGPLFRQVCRVLAHDLLIRQMSAFAHSDFFDWQSGCQQGQCFVPQVPSRCPACLTAAFGLLLERFTKPAGCVFFATQYQTISAGSWRFLALGRPRLLATKLMLACHVRHTERLPVSCLCGARPTRRKVLAAAASA